MKRRITDHLVWVVLAALLVVLLFRLGHDPAARDSPMVGCPMPPIYVLKSDGVAETITAKAWHGQVVMVNFWATWCAYCKQEHGLLMAIQANYHVPIIGVAYKDNPMQMQQHLKRYGNPYVVVGTDQFGKTAIDWGISATPETFVVDRTGIIRFHHRGVLTPRLFQGTVLPLIQQLR